MHSSPHSSPHSSSPSSSHSSSGAPSPTGPDFPVDPAVDFSDESRITKEEIESAEHAQPGELDFPALMDVARYEAARVLTLSGGHEVDDVVGRSVKELLIYMDSHEVTNPGGLIRVIARRQALRYRDRWERDRRNTDVDAPGFDLAKPVSSVDLVPEQLDVDALLAVLDDRDLELVERKLAGCTDAEIAAALGLAPQTVRNRLVALRRRLREHAH